MRFKDKVVLITGAGAGIGALAAARFGEEGAKVACNSLSSSAEKIVQQLAEKGAEAFFVRGDVAAQDAAARVVDTVVERFGRIDVLVNNAGIVIGGSIENTTVEDFHKTMDVNVLGTLLMSQYAVKYMKKQGEGVIVNVSSVAGIKGHLDRLAYSASKGAVIAMTKAMALELCHDNIRVNCVCPGTTLTPSLRDRIQASSDPEEALRKFCGRQPIGRLGRPEEIAEAILFSACGQAAFMTGSTIVIDGGMTI